jgi:class 3 adenylate cyclase/tetratricopeptide (TPR) repeat protein
MSGTNCSHAIPDGAKFCPECGAATARHCTNCGVELSLGTKFCVECGTATATASLAPATAVDRSPRSYTPKHLADKILQSKSALEGERKQVTVLFADVEGSMELAEQLDPEEWHAILERFFEILTEGVHRFEGTVNQYTGDGIMALFGAPIAHEDHAQRACYAALQLREEIARYATELRRQHGLGFSTRIGINSGEVVVGRIGDDLRMDYTAQGHTVGLAQRMESLAEPNTCFLSEATAALVKGYFALDDLGEFTVKGVAAPLQVHRLGAVGELHTRLDVSRSRGFSRFVGRGDEMQTLESALAHARDGNAQVVGIVGDAGLGKSRLCFEFLERCRAHGLMTYETSGVSHGKSIPFLPMLRLFRAFFGITDQDSDATARERIAGRLLLLDEGLRDSLPLLFEFMAVPDLDNPGPDISPEARQRQLFDILRRVTQARGQKETQVILIEDLHWFDGGSAAFLEPLIEATVGTRALVLLNFRPEYQAPWMGKSFYHQLPIAPLGAEAIRELLDALLGTDASLKGLAKLIHAHTSGNPFFTEEVVQNLIESGKLQGSKGAYQLVTPVDRLEVPGSVQALLTARIDRLTERDKDVLQTAAVIGREFDEPTLAAVVEQDAPQLREALQKLKDTEFVYEQSLYPVAEYLFKHPLTQEVALNSQLHERRRRLHAAVARVIEAAHSDDLDQQAALLAHHWEASGDLGQAVRWHRRAADWAGANDPVEGLRHWHKVRELGHGLDDADVNEARLRACVAILAAGSWRLGMNEAEIQATLDEGRVLAQQLGLPNAVATLLVGVSAHHGMLGRVDAALEVAAEAAAMINDGMNRDEVMAIETGAYWLMVGGRLPQALEAFDRISELCDSDPQIGRKVIGYSPLIWAEHLAAWSLAMMGRFDACWPRAERAIHLAREHQVPENLTWALMSLSIVANMARRTSRVPVMEVRRACVEGFEIAEAGGSVYSQIAASFALAVAEFLSGEYQDSGERLIATLERARTTGTGLEHHGYYRAVLAETFLARGEVDTAIASAREAVQVADAGGTWFYAALARAVLVDALAQANAEEDTIVAIIAEARELVHKSGGNSLLPRLREAEVRLLSGSDHAALVTGLREAEAMYSAMGATDPAERLAREIGT